MSTSTSKFEEATASVGPNSISDQPTKNDTLGFAPYVEAVAAFLTHKDTQPPLTLSVEGAWGSGKSSFMLQLEEKIKSKNGKTVWFNAWRHDKEEELWAAFALSFTKELAATVPWWKRIFLHIKLSLLRFNWKRGWFQLIKFLILSWVFIYISMAVYRYAKKPGSGISQFLMPSPTSSPIKESIPKPEELLLALLLKIGGTAAYILLASVLIKKIVDVIGNPLEIKLTNYIRDPKYDTRTAFIDTFHSDFKLLVKTYAEGQRVFVFVDDLDRCEVPKAADLMQALNLLISESAPIFYILGLDREKIAAGLAAKYEKLLPYLAENITEEKNINTYGVEFGFSYLEKFIQLPFSIPQPAEKDIDKLLDSLSIQNSGSRPTPSANSEIEAGLLVEVSTDSPLVRNVIKMVAPSFDHNPRRLKQFLNLFRLRALLASQTGLFGTPRKSEFTPLTFEQLGKLVAISLHWPSLLTDVSRQLNLLHTLQYKAWHPEFKLSEPSENTARFWVQKHNLMELLEFPNPNVTEEFSSLSIKEREDRFGLSHVDIERFLQVAPVMQGRELSSVDEQELSKITSELKQQSSSKFRNTYEEMPSQAYKIESPISSQSSRRNKRTKIGVSSPPPPSA